MHKKPTSIDEVYIKRIALPKKESHGNRVHLNTLLDICTKIMLYHLHCA